MRKMVVLVLTSLLCSTAFTGCLSSSAVGVPANEHLKAQDITVVTSYGVDDGARVAYIDALKAFEASSGVDVKDISATANEEWKTKVMASFETGSEPDVLFYFTGADSNRLVAGEKVISLEEIRKIYPEYASNMKDDTLSVSSVDGKCYSVPVTEYWEGLFVNKKVLAECGVSVPNAETTWEKFLADCEVIKSKGYTPIAVSLQETPNYMFEFCVYNFTSPKTHGIVPANGKDPAAEPWVSGLNDMKALYEAGFLPENTTTAFDAETFQLMADNKAAFAIDGSWKIGWFEKHCKDRIEDFTVTFVPGKNGRKTTDILGGFSMGYFITAKAWNDPDKQNAAVRFVEAMTSDDVVMTFNPTVFTALKNKRQQSELNSLQKDAIAMLDAATAKVPSVQDGLYQAQRTVLFDSVKNIALGKISATDVVVQALAAQE